MSDDSDFGSNPAILALGLTLIFLGIVNAIAIAITRAPGRLAYVSLLIFQVFGTFWVMEYFGGDHASLPGLERLMIGISLFYVLALLCAFAQRINYWANG